MRRLLLLVSALFVGASASCADGFGMFGSYWDAEDAGSDYGYGVKLQLDNTPTSAYEFRLGYFKEFNSESDDPGTIDIMPLEAAFVFKMPVSSRFLPYFGGGTGYYLFDVESELRNGVAVDFEMDNELGWFALGGVELWLSRGTILFAEAKYTWLEATATVSGPDISEGVDVKFDGWGINLGLLFRM